MPTMNNNNMVTMYNIIMNINYNNMMNMNNNIMNNNNNMMNMNNNMMNMNNNIMNNNTNMMNLNYNNIMNMNNNMMNSNIMNKTYITLQKEFEFCSKDEILKQIVFNFPLDGYNLFKWKVSMYGAKDTPYEGGIFTFLILFPKNYPNQGPEFKFVNKILHLNVDFKRDDGKCGDGHNSLSSLNEWGSIGKVKDKKGYGVKQALFDFF